MKKLLAVIVAVLIPLSTSVQAEEWTGNINVFLGGKTLDEDDWEPIEEQGEIGIKVDFREKSWPVNIAIDLLSSRSDEENGVVFDPSFGSFNAELEGTTSEFNIGVRKIWDQFPTVRPFIGGGVSFISAEVEISAFGDKISDDDTGTGFWLGGGVYWTLSEHFNLGLDLTVSSAEVDIFGEERNAGGGHFGLLAGYHW